MTLSIFNLPEYRIGPYVMRFVPASRAMFVDKRRILEHDWTAGRTLIANWVSERRAVECAMRSLVTAIHYRSGLNDKSDEESYTHSLATGLVELAHNNEQFWGEWQQLLEDEYCPGAGWGRAVAGDPDIGEPALPSEVTFDGRRCQLVWVDPAKWDTPHAYGWYLLKTGPIRITKELYGAQLALITIHEVLHFIHECVGLKDRTPEIVFKRVQSYCLLRFLQQNPTFWAWWLNLVRWRIDPLPLAA